MFGCQTKFAAFFFRTNVCLKRQDQNCFTRSCCHNAVLHFSYSPYSSAELWWWGLPLLVHHCHAHMHQCLPVSPVIFHQEIASRHWLHNSSAEERESEIAVHKDMLRMQIKTSEDERRKVVMELRERRMWQIFVVWCQQLSGRGC